MQYSTIPFDRHVTQAFAQLEQGANELLDTYLDCTSELLSRIYHTTDMYRILVRGLNHYTVVYGLNCRWLKDSVVGHQSIQWKTMEDCFRDIHNTVAGYERTTGYYRADFNTPEASMITNLKTIKELRPYYRCSRSHLQNNCTNHKSNIGNKLQNTSSTWQNYKGTTTKDFITIRTTVISSPQECYHSKCPCKQGHLMTCC